MSTRANPSPHDGLTKIGPEGEYFAITYKDDDGEMFVRLWAMWRMLLIDSGVKPESDREAIREAIACATEMKIQNREYRVQQQMAALEFDDAGAPTTGQHRRRDKNSTSGANDG